MCRPPEVGESKDKGAVRRGVRADSSYQTETLKVFPGTMGAFRGHQGSIWEGSGEDFRQHHRKGVCPHESGGREPSAEAGPTTFQPSPLRS